MIKKVEYSVLALLLAVGLFLAGSRFGPKGGAISERAGGSTEVLRYICPMHPQFTSVRPGDCPSCGMRLVPQHAEGVSAQGARGGISASEAQTLGISLSTQQLLGVRVQPVEKASGANTLRLLGRVAPDEGRIYRINAGTDGFIGHVYDVTTGSRVRKNQLLATFSAPDATSAINLFIVNSGAAERLARTSDGSPDTQAMLASANLRQRIDQLRNLGMSDFQMEEIRRTREYPEHIKILAPADGFVMARNVSPGLKFNRGEELYRVADLSRVWILADVFEYEAEFLKPGVIARASLPNLKKSLTARVSDVLPQFDPATRTLKVRLEVTNPDFALRPDMFVDVELPVELPAAIAIPADAVLNSGLKQTVFIETSQGIFEPREVQTGRRYGGKIEITAGLMPGERIAVSGTFLIDSESRMKAAVQDALIRTVSRDPVCGMEVDTGEAKAAGRVSLYQGKNYFFCAESCMHTFDKTPVRYVKPQLAAN